MLRFSRDTPWTDSVFAWVLVVVMVLVEQLIFEARSRRVSRGR